MDQVVKQSYPGIETELLHRMNDGAAVFKHFPHRLQILEVCQTDPVKPHLYDLLKVMKELYMELLKKFCTGKKYLELQNSWFFHTNIYFDQSFKVEGITAVRAKQLYDS